MLKKSREPQSHVSVTKPVKQSQRCWVLFAAILWFLGPSVSLVKGQTYLQSYGGPTFSNQIPVENGYIDASNGRLHLEIPLSSAPQRGLSQLKTVLMYDSNIWTSYWQPSNVLDSAGYGSISGWRVVSSLNQGQGYQGYTITNSGYCTSDGNPRYENWSNWTWTSPDGTKHSFPINNIHLAISACGGGSNPTGAAFAG